MTDKVYVVKGFSATSDESWVVSIHSTLQGAKWVQEYHEQKEREEYPNNPNLEDIFTINEYPLLT